VADGPGGDADWLSGIDTPDQLGALLDQVGDDDVVSVVSSTGPDEVLARIFDGMVARFMPGRAGNRDVVVQWTIKVGDHTYPYRMALAEGRMTVEKGEAASPTVNLTMALPDLLRLVAGRVNGMNAFMSGKLKVEGDLMLANSIESWFER
jgi:putative sterol carrier protein